MSTLLLSHCSHYRQTVTATVSLRSVVLRVVAARSEKFADMEGDDDGASAQTALACLYFVSDSDGDDLAGD